MLVKYVFRKLVVIVSLILALLLGTLTAKADLFQKELDVFVNNDAQNLFCRGIILYNAAQGEYKPESETVLKVVNKCGKFIKEHRIPKGASGGDFKIQNFHGKPVFTWWEGKLAFGHGFAKTYYISDFNFKIKKVINLPKNITGDFHEFNILPDDTAVFSSYRPIKVDGRKVLDSGFHRYNIDKNKLFFSWNAIDHVKLSESVVDYSYEENDFFHINSINLTPDNNYLISARNTSALYKISAKTGRIIWRLGGKKSNFKMDSVLFQYQHDAKYLNKNTITLFDNHTDLVEKPYESSILFLDVDEIGKTVKVQKRITHPQKLKAVTMGNSQVLPNGNIFGSWGRAGRIVEFDSQGNLVFDAKLTSNIPIYRAFYYSQYNFGLPKLTKEYEFLQSK